MGRQFALCFAAAIVLLLQGTGARGGITLEPVGQWGGEALDVGMAGNRAYAAIGPRVVVLELSDPTQPVRLGQSEPLGCAITELRVTEPYVYAATWYTCLQVVDVSDPAQLVRVGGYVDAICHEIDTELPYAYLVRYDPPGYYLLMFDVGDPTAPKLLSVYDIGLDALDVAAREGYVYLAVHLGGYYFGVLCIDVHDPADPVLKGTYVNPYPGDTIFGIATKGNYLFFVGYDTGLHVLDISSPPSMVPVGAAPAERANLLSIPDQRAFVGEHWDLELFDVSAPTEPAWLGAFSGLNWLRGVGAAGNYACAADCIAAVRVLDVSDPAAIKSVGTYDRVLGGSDVAYHAGYAYVGGSLNAQIISVADPAAPERVAVAETGYGYDFAFADPYAYVAAASKGLFVLDVSDPAAPVQVGALMTKSKALNLALAGQYLWVADHVAGVTVVDVHDPTAPTWVDTYHVGNAQSVTVRDEYAYVADGEGNSLYVMQFVDGKLSVVGQCPTIGSARDVVLDGQYAYVAAWSQGVDVIDISDPANPHHVATCDKAWPAQSVALLGDYLFVADGVMTHVVDVSDPLQPERLFLYFAGGSARDVAVDAGYLYVADGEAGLEVVGIYIPGDLNCDGRVDAFDIDPFVQALVDPAGYVAAHPTCHLANADCSADGRVDAFDIDPFVDLLTLEAEDDPAAGAACMDALRVAGADTVFGIATGGTTPFVPAMTGRWGTLDRRHCTSAGPPSETKRRPSEGL